MVGRTPEYLGKKIQAREIKLVSLGILVTPLVVLVTTGLAIATQAGMTLDLRRPTPGLLGDPLRLPLPGQQQRLRLRRLHRLHPAQRARQCRRLRNLLRRPARRRDDDAARFLPILLVLAVAGSLAGKKVSPAGPGTMRTDTPTFVFLLVGVVDPGRRPHLLPRPPARSDRAEPDHEVVLRCGEDLITSILAIIVFDVFLGLAYPLAITGISQVVFPGKADGSRITSTASWSARADRPVVLHSP